MLSVRRTHFSGFDDDEFYFELSRRDEFEVFIHTEYLGAGFRPLYLLLL